MSDYTVQYHQYDLPDTLKLGDQVAIDCEMMGLNFTRDRLCTVQIHARGDQTVHIVHFPEPVYDSPNLKKLLSKPDILFVGHMIRLDLQTIGYHLGVIPKNVFCTRTASRIAQTYGASHNYGDLVLQFTGTQLDKSQTSTYWGSLTLTDDQIRYAIDDVIPLHSLKTALEHIVTSEKRQDVLNAAMSMLPYRVLIDIKGWNKEDILDFPF